jgi:hypothetical protein
MFAYIAKNKRITMFCAGLAAAASLAAGSSQALGQSPGDGMLRINSQGRKVRVTRGTPHLAQLSEAGPAPLAESPAPQAEPEGADWQQDWDAPG